MEISVEHTYILTKTIICGVKLIAIISEFEHLNYIPLLEKYTSEMYSMFVEYPHKRFWHQTVDDSAYRSAIRTLLTDGMQAPLLLYVHIPFCPKLCYFCSCHTKIATKYKPVSEYLELLFMEIGLLSDFMRDNNVVPNFRELHFGGGSPTMLTQDDFALLCRKLSQLTDISSLNEFALEIDPRTASLDQLAFYRNHGVTRISFGVQDFDPNVQKAIGRIQPPELLEKLLAPEVRSWFAGINFDIMWGLPKQTRYSFSRTIETAIHFSPDRISLLLLHYAPDVKKNQFLMQHTDFPSYFERTLLFLDAVKMLTEAGYVRIGFDHFAKPTDAVAIALKEEKCCWNPLGYTAGRYQDVIGIGTGSSSRITESYYAQNVYDQQEYSEHLKSGSFPVFREYELTIDDMVRRDLLHRLRGYGYVNCREFESRHGITFNTYFADELSNLTPFINDQLVCFDGDQLLITTTGRLFNTLICRVFDRYSTEQEACK
jgi:oxygen-independent coproporphyrinogen-3 oxidase